LYNIIESERNEVSIDEYLKNIEMTVRNFMEKNSVWDRKELVGGLEDIARKKGTFACVLGGKSTGKSLVLKAFAQNETDKRKVVYVNMRNGYPSITYGVVSALKSNNVDLEDLALKFLKKALSKVKIIDGIEIDFNPFLDVIKTESDPTTILR
jgi:hypothetical protein